MSDVPTSGGWVDRARVSQTQDHEIRHFEETMQQMFPDRSMEEIRCAITQALEEAGEFESRSFLRHRAAEHLRTC